MNLHLLQIYAIAKYDLFYIPAPVLYFLVAHQQQQQ